MEEIVVIPLQGIPEVTSADDLALALAQACEQGSRRLADHDVVVIAHKVVSKTEGRLAPAKERDAVIEQGSRRLLRRAGEVVISETHHGFVCANAGVDASNAPADEVVLLPVDPDTSARRVRARLEHISGCRLGIVISDTFGRAWRLGQTNVAIGVAGIEPFIDYRGDHDAHGRVLNATRICVADELAGAAEMVMGKSENIPAAIVRGARVGWGRGAAVEIVRPLGEDMFR